MLHDTLCLLTRTHGCAGPIQAGYSISLAKTRET